MKTLDVEAIYNDKIIIQEDFNSPDEIIISKLLKYHGPKNQESGRIKLLSSSNLSTVDIFEEENKYLFVNLKFECKFQVKVKDSSTHEDAIKYFIYRDLKYDTDYPHFSKIMCGDFLYEFSKEKYIKYRMRHPSLN